MDSKRLIIAALLSVIVLVGWGLLFPPAERTQPLPVEDPFDLREPVPAPVRGDSAPAAPIAPAEAAAAEGVSEAADEPPIRDSAERFVELEDDAVVARFTNRGAQLVSLRLKGTAGYDGRGLEMVRDRLARDAHPFALFEPDGSESALNSALFTAEETGNGVRFSYRGPEGTAVKEFVLEEENFVEVEISVEGRTDWSLMLGPGVRNPTAQEFASRYTNRRWASYYLADELEDEDANSAGEPLLVDGAGVRWAGLEDTYFLTILAPAFPVRQLTMDPMLPSSTPDGTSYITKPKELTDEQKDLATEYRVLVTPGTESFSGRSFWGAKIYEDLEAVPGGLGLQKTIRYSWFGFMALPMRWGLLWIHENVVANFGWSIVLLTVFIKVLMAPLTHKSYLSSRKMQGLQPKMSAIKQKWRSKLKDKKGRPNMDAQRKQNEELQALMKKEGVNPLGGCLPMLLQMPFFFAFFTLLQNSVELWNAPWAFWIHDLSAKDPLYILPIVMGASQFLQQRMIGTTSMEPSQRMMMNVMPIMFMFFFFQAPSGLVLYWVTSNILTIAQQGIFKQLKSSGIIGGDEEESSS